MPTAIIWKNVGQPTLYLDYAVRLYQHLTTSGFDVQVLNLVDEKNHIHDSTKIAKKADLHILTGGEMQVDAVDTYMGSALRMTRAMIEASSIYGTQVTGICLGSQMIAETVSPGSVIPNETIKAGYHFIDWEEGETGPQIVPLFHYHKIAHDLVSGVDVRATRDDSVQAFTVPGTEVTGIQYHPEFSEHDVECLLHHNHELITSLNGNPVEDMARGEMYSPAPRELVSTLLSLNLNSPVI